MKTVSSEMTTHLAQETTTLTRMAKIIRTDGVTFYFTSHDKDLPFDGNTYISSSGFSSTAMESKSDFTVDNIELAGIFDDEIITDQDLRAGRFDFADVYLFFVNWQDTTTGPIKMKRGKFGEAISSPQGWFQIELRGMTQLLQQTILELYGAQCRADLGDVRCGIPLNPPLRQNTEAYTVGQFIKVATNMGGIGEQMFENRIYQCTTAGTTASSMPTYDTTDGHTTTDGSAVFTAQESWTRNGVVATVTDAKNITITTTESRATDGWFQYGVLSFDSGLNAGRALEVKVWTSLSAGVQFYVSAGYPMAPGDVFAITPGCDKSLLICKNKFNNLLNLRGEPFLPGDDAMFFYPDPAPQ